MLSMPRSVGGSNKTIKKVIANKGIKPKEASPRLEYRKPREKLKITVCITGITSMLK
jgi:hypothetical protein